MTDATESIVGLVPPVLATGVVLMTLKMFNDMQQDKKVRSIQDMV